MPISPENYFGGLHSRLGNLYECHCDDCSKLDADNNKNEKVFKEVLNAAEKALKHLHKKGSYQAEDINDKVYQKLINETYKVFDETIRDNDIPEEMREKLQNDAFIFSGLKTHSQLLEASTMLLDKEGKIRSFEQFAQDFNKVNKKYNQNYLEAEWQFAISSSQSAANWTNLDKDGRYDLQYRTANDDKVRDQHQALHDITLPKDDEFWLSYYPPNGWRCRCRVVEVLKDKYELSNSETALQLGEKATTQLDKNGKNKLEIFRFNPGAEQKLFPPKHPYNKVKGAETLKKVLESDTSKYDEAIFRSLGGNAEEYVQSETHKKALKINDKIRPAETFCIDKYSIDFYRDVNFYLRNGRKPKEEFFERYIKVMNGGLDKLEKYEGTVYRGADLSPEVINIYKKALETGKSIKENNYLSTSRIENGAFNKNTKYKIISKNGKKIEELSYFPNEKEVLFKEGTKFRVTNISEEDGKTLIEMEEL